MGSESDREVVSNSEKVLSDFGIDFETKVLSAHRTPDKVHDFAKNAEARGFSLIIAAAGKAAHLPGVIASFTVLPVIGIPMKTSDLGGLDSLFSIVQMPKGVPVATVTINGAENAGLLAAEIIALKDNEVKRKLIKFKEGLAK
jgi:5-(carboxyamino)imidazole ribonucleotide mutase